MTRKLKTSATTSPRPSHFMGAIGSVALGILLASSGLQTWFSRQDLATNFVSLQTFAAILANGKEVSYLSIAPVVAGAAVLAWLGGAIWIAWTSGRRFTVALTQLGLYGGAWWCLIDLWEWLWMGSGMLGLNTVNALLAGLPQFWLAFCASGWITTLVCLGQTHAEQIDLPAVAATNAASTNSASGLPRQPNSKWIWLACGLYILIFTTMNWRLYFNLLIPHGDSAMYEEHLWNLLHGKGFRSYLDQGLFFGEHIQFVHLFLIPIYILWPSHLLLELCESTALALGALPVYWMALRHTKSDRTALATAVAYLLYAPMQFLDIEIDLKTFRPEAFGIPLLLMTLDQLERRNLIGFLIGVAMTLTVKEDYSIVFGPLGLWIGGRALLPARSSSFSNGENKKESADGQECPSSRTWVFTGIALSLFSVAYLWLATRVVMPWFRSGSEIHYVSYFGKLGKTPEEILKNLFLKPEHWTEELISFPAAFYVIALLAPAAFLPLLSPARFAVGAPLLGILCLSPITRDHRLHFHAPLVAIIFWAATGGLPQAERLLNWAAKRLRLTGTLNEATAPILVRTFLWSTTLTTGFFFSLSPLGISFWDPGSSWCWQKLYASSRRAELFESVPPLIPLTSRVASTDFVHPRFTHHERSYDYSDYPRKVSDYKLQVPDDTDFIVIDTQHPYSKIKRPEEIREYREHPDQWELLPDTTDGYFIVLRRRR